MLPASYRPRPRPLKELLVIPILVVGIVCNFKLYEAFDNARSRNTDIQVQLSILQKQIQSKQSELKVLTEAQQSATRAQEAVKVMLAEKQKLATTTVKYGGVLNLAGPKLTDGEIILTSIVQVGGKLSISGAAIDHTSAVLYGRRLQNSGAFSAVEVATLTTIMVGAESTQTEITYIFTINGEERVIQPGEEVTLFTINAVI